MNGRTIPFAGVRPAWWLLMVGLVGAAAYRFTYVDSVSIAGYWPAVASSSGIFLLFSCAVAAVSAAIEGGRERRGRLGSYLPTRPMFAIAARRLWPTITAGITVQLFGFLSIAHRTWGAPGFPPLIVFASFGAILLLHTCLGYVLGARMSAAIAIPLALVASYCWLGFTWSVSYFPLRYLSGLEIVNCCSLDMALDYRGPLVTVVFSAVAGLGILGIHVALHSLSWRHRAVGCLISAVMIVSISSAALYAARDFGPGPTQLRSESDATCSGFEPTICLFPEQIRADDPSEVLRAAYANLVRAGVPVPRTVRFSQGDSSTATLRMAGGVEMSADDILHSFTSALLPTVPASYCGDQADFEMRIDTYEVAANFLRVEAGKGIDTVSPIVGSPKIQSQTDRLIRLPIAKQVEWFEKNRETLERCDVHPTSIVSR